MKQVTIQGEPGCFHEEAARRYFGDEPIALPDDAVAIANSVPLTDDDKLDSDASVWLLLG